MNSLFETSLKFYRYSNEHILVLLIFLIVGILFIFYTKEWPRKRQKLYLQSVAILMSILQLAKVVIRYFDGTLDTTTDLPFHLCNFLPFIMIYVIAYESRKVWGIVFIWIILGTSQANFTPVVENSLFYYDAIRYWLNHCGLVILALYPVFRWKWKLKHRDVWTSILSLNALAILIFFVNKIFASNYFYIMHKPAGTTAFSLMPQWPYYILVIEVLLILFGYFLLFFFWLTPKMLRSSVESS